MFYYSPMQFAFDFMGGRPAVSDGKRRPDRYFFALLPDPETEQLIDRLAHELWLRLQLPKLPVGIGKYHLSLWSLHVPDGPDGPEVAAACRAAPLVDQAPFSICFNQVASFGGPPNWPLVLMSTVEMPAARWLQLAIGEALRRGGVKSPAQPFEPHVSLVYDKRRWASFRVPDLVWNVRDFALVRSMDRKRYDILGCWPLRG